METQMPRPQRRCAARRGIQTRAAWSWCWCGRAQGGTIGRPRDRGRRAARTGRWSMRR
ncbi:hypothetical protein B0T18DRAFT_408635 [Schizothecium vesticola]|uniref:Uncharacterized protein n=1 Tax=Schizothecium vesticola TaxID=314040 RepID=A0AA40F336_9PEZI|nr:hypothetical protein B0T18DRAFT_408635 [Schizothecium vesticola]